MGHPGSVRSLPGRLPAGVAQRRSDRRPVPRRPAGQPVPGPGAPPRARRNIGAPGKERRRPVPDTQTPHPRPRTTPPPQRAKTDRPPPSRRPRGEVRDAWHAKETVRGIYQTHHPGEGDQYTRLLTAELQDQSCSPELNQLGRTLHTWHSQIVAWHHARVSNGPTESANNLINASPSDSATSEPASSARIIPRRHSGYPPADNPNPTASRTETRPPSLPPTGYRRAGTMTDYEPPPPAGELRARIPEE